MDILVFLLLTSAIACTGHVGDVFVKANGSTEADQMQCDQVNTYIGGCVNYNDRNSTIYSGHCPYVYKLNDLIMLRWNAISLNVTSCSQLN